MSDQHILSLSYGKDSIACLGAIEELGWQLDRIVHAEIWATDTIPADLPPMVEFKAKADRIIKERYGIEVEHIRAKRTYEECFYTTCNSKNHDFNGKIYGFPRKAKNWCNSRLKISVLGQFGKSDIIQYIGIAADESDRFHNLTERKQSPLVTAGWDERKCRQWCEENNLLSPIYTTAQRGGCWFCHYQPIEQLRLLRKNYPEYWALMLKWDTDSPVLFHPDGHTVHDFDRRFQLEDDGYISPNDRRFCWNILGDDYLYSQITLFDLTENKGEDFHEEKTKHQQQE